MVGVTAMIANIAAKSSLIAFGTAGRFARHHALAAAIWRFAVG
jgi:hypothetical protein